LRSRAAQLCLAIALDNNLPFGTFHSDGLSSTKSCY
jgi:hypothetical protein